MVRFPSRVLASSTALAAATSLLVAAAPAVTHASVPRAVVFAAKKGITPTTAAAARKTPQEEARTLRMSGNHSAAAGYLADEAVRLKDPVLFLDSADAYKTTGEEAREIESVQKAREQALIATDMLEFLGDDRASQQWQPVSGDHREALLSRAATLVAQCEILVDEITAEQGAPVEAPVEKKERRPGKGMGLIIAGAGLGVVGLAGLGLGIAGLGIGSNAQSEVDDPRVYGPDYDVWDEKGKRANKMAYIGLPLAAVGLGGGIALIVLGLKKRKSAGAEEEAPLDEGDGFAKRLRISPSTNGFVLSGRF
jgi:hypothetical protein